MESPKLNSLLVEEQGAFHQVTGKWRPTSLFLDIQVRNLMADMEYKYSTLNDAKVELSVLVRSSFYLTSLRQMKFIVRRAKFVRRSNHLVFGQAVSEFYSVYGEVLRFLELDKLKGKIEPKLQSV